MSPGSAGVVRLWLLRMLVTLDCQKAFFQPMGFCSELVAAAVGLSSNHDDRNDRREEKDLRVALRGLHRRAERSTSNAQLPNSLMRNVERLQALIGLTDTDCRILEFAILINTDRALDDGADLLGSLTSAKAFHVIATLLDLPAAAVRASLNSNSLLARTGLVNVTKQGCVHLRTKLDLLSASFADQMMSVQDDPIALLRDTVVPCAAPDLNFSDFEHVDETLKILRAYLRRAIDVRKCGVNVFIYGEPGTGKSQLARLLARDAECELYEVSTEDGDGDPVDGKRRLRSFGAVQSFFRQRERAIILFDETEDVFSGGGLYGRKSTAQTRKAWMNRMLESNSVPSLWLSNSVSCLDPAFVRRFDLVLELTIPSRRRREAIIAQACGDLLCGAGTTRVAAAEQLAPAVVTRAAAVIRSVRDMLPTGEVSAAVQRLVENTLVAQGHPSLQRGDAGELPAHYDPRFVNADSDLIAVGDGILRSRAARICLHGPPGTGKTAFGRWLADRLDRPLLARKASDILSCYLGETEQNMAEVFREARADDAILMIDEVDSFLRDRRWARHSWEVTAVNEMLSQMEGFGGIFIASTNLIEGIDQAALRRFDLKLQFGYLKIDQAWDLFLCQCGALGLAPPGPALRARLALLEVLTPGDYAAVARQHRFRTILDADGLLNALIAECSLKEDGRKRAIGFI